MHKDHYRYVFSISVISAYYHYCLGVIYVNVSKRIFCFILGRSHPIRTISTPSPINSQNVRRTTTTSGNEQNVSPDTSTNNVPPDQVEMAEEAFAYQTFNQHTGTGNGARHTPSPVDVTSQDIPLEDLSQKKKKHSKKLPNVRLQNVTSSSHNRSHSHSPKREEGLNSSRGRSYSLRDNSKRERSSTPKGREHSKSEPVHETNRSRPSSSGSSSDESHILRNRSRESQSPKSLRPADAPALTLFSPDNGPISTGSIKLVPPAESIKSPSDTSSTGTSSDGIFANVEHSDSSNTPTRRDSNTMPNFSFKSPSAADVEISTATVVNVAQAKSSSASDQLTKLAQIVQEHFSDDSNGPSDIPTKNSEF